MNRRFKLVALAIYMCYNLVYDPKSVAALEIEFIAPIPEQIAITVDFSLRFSQNALLGSQCVERHGCYEFQILDLQVD